MSNKETIIEAIKKQGFLPLFYHASLEESKKIIQSLFEAGVRVVEYTNRGGNALYNFGQLVEIRNKLWPGMILAAGTVKTAKEAKTYCRAGADLIICPAVVKAVGKKLTEEDILWIPGCLTPTEVLHAAEAGATLIKIFPGSLLGAGYISALREIYPDLDFIVTGGVDVKKQDLEGWFKAGVVAVGLGNRLISKERVEKKEYYKISELAKELIDIIKAIKTPV